jgi:hypothetical protein
MGSSAVRLEGGKVSAWRGKTAISETLWPESTSELYRPSDHRLSANLVLTFAYRGRHVVSVMDSYGRILGFLVRSSYFLFQVAPKFYSRV